MTHSLLLSAAVLAGAIIFLFSRLVYRYERGQGRSHENALKESAALRLFLLGTTAFDYVAVVLGYA